MNIDRSVLKIAVEQEGGIDMTGNSGHYAVICIQRYMYKNNLAISEGWMIIRRTPPELKSPDETIELIKSVLKRITF